MVQIARKVCWTDAGNSSASLMSWPSNSTDVALFASLLFVSLFPPLTKRFSLVLILLALDISLWLTSKHAETPTFPTWVGSAAKTQAFTWKSLSVWALELSANVICWNLDPRFTDVTAWEPYFLRKLRYSLHEFGFSMFTGKSSRSFRNVPFKVEMSSLTRHSLLTWIFSVNACHSSLLWTFALCCYWYRNTQRVGGLQRGAQAWLGGKWFIKFLGICVIFEVAARRLQSFLHETFGGELLKDPVLMLLKVGQ